MLLPAWVAALVAATMPLWPWSELRAVGPVFLMASVLALVMSPFGQETHYGTFGLLLVQPEERKRFWRTKTTLLGLAMLFVWGMAMATCYISDHSSELLWDCEGVTIIMLVAYSGGLWSTLLLRDVLSAFFCTCLVPGIISVLTIVAVGHWIDPDSKTFLHILCAVLGVYAVAGYCWARHLFLEAQDVGWTGGQISLKFGSGRSLRWLAFDCKYGQSRWMSLVQKELQLHEATMVLVPLFLLLHVAVITLAYFNPKWASDTHELICHAVPAVWLAAVPLVIGCVAVAGERRFNTLEGLLCLPVSKRASFAVKLIVALVLAVVLGGLLPWLLMRIQAAPLGDFTVWVAMGVAALIACVSFYASTMSNGLLQAMPTVVGIGFAVFLTSALGARTYGYFHQWRYQDYGFFMSSLFPALAWPAGVITFIWLSFRNYRQAQTGWGMWVENYVRVVAAFVCLYLVGMGIFYRDWQLFLPLEPRHGAARISGTGAATLVAWKKHAAVVLPDGRLWVGGGKEAWKVESGGFVADTNWVKVAAHYTGAIALKSDGTLWQIMGRTDLRQIGSDSDWADIAAGEGVFFAVKRDGTLWGWGHDHGDLLSEKSASENHGIDVPKPTQVQNGSDWVKIFLPSYGKAVAIKSDGSAWELSRSYFRTRPATKPPPFSTSSGAPPSGPAAVFSRS